MPIDLLKHIITKRPKGQALLGLDVGKKTIGVALSNPDQTIATPLDTIKRIKFSQDIIILERIITDYEIKGLVIGLPLNMDNTEGPRAQSIRDFALEIKNNSHLLGANPWISYWDERLSTVSVDNIVDTYVEKRKTKQQAKQRGLIDKLAAQIILQGALDYIQLHSDG